VSAHNLESGQRAAIICRPHFELLDCRPYRDVSHFSAIFASFLILSGNFDLLTPSRWIGQPISQLMPTMRLAKNLTKLRILISSLANGLQAPWCHRSLQNQPA